jgi:hypothetical protein
MADKRVLEGLPIPSTIRWRGCSTPVAGSESRWSKEGHPGPVPSRIGSASADKGKADAATLVDQANWTLGYEPAGEVSGGAEQLRCACADRCPPV